MEENDKTPTFPNGPAKLMINLLGFTPAEFLEMCSEHDNYTVHKLRKKSGGFRIINEPCPCLKKFQARFLKRWLYRLYLRGYLDRRIYSFLPKLSAAKNVQAHADKINGNFVIRFDLKNAFPSITSDMVANALEWAIKKEMVFLKDWKERSIRAKEYETNWRDAYPRDPLFPNKRVKWLRKMIRNEKQNGRVDDIMSQFISRIVKLTTYNGCLPQGAPSSPFLLNLVISHLNLIGNISSWLKLKGYSNFTTAYCDDFVISTFREPTPEIIEELIANIEKTGLKINREKTLIFNRRQIAPLIMGLRLIKTPVRDQELEKLFAHLPKVRGTKRRYLKKGTWQLNKIAIPKKYLRQTRAMMHNLAACPLDEKLALVVRGRLNYIKSIYGFNMPNQLRKPYLDIKKAGIKIFLRTRFYSE